LSENLHRNEINGAVKQIRFKRRCNKFMNTYELKSGVVKRYRKKAQIEDVFPHRTSKLDLKYGWTHAT
jgi:hypothetical protein